jgi:hypothetical protein
MAGRRRALLIDASAGTRFPGHPTSLADIERLRDVLNSAEIGRFEVSTAVKTDEETTKAAIRQFFAESQPDDVLLFYFVGFLLISSSDQLWFALTATDPSSVETTSISSEFVLAEIKASAARNVVVVLDARIGVPQGCVSVSPWDHRLEAAGKSEAILAVSAGPDFSFPAQLPAPQLDPSFTELIVNGLLELSKTKSQITIAELSLYLHTRPASSSPTLVTRIDDSAGQILLAPSRDEARYPQLNLPRPPEPQPSEQPSPPEENVQFTVYRPATLVAERWHRMLVFTHIDEAPDLAPGHMTPAQEVAERAQRILADELENYRKLAADSQFPVPRESEITLVPDVPKLTFNPPRRSFVWATDLRVHDESFLLRAPHNLAGSLVRGRLSVFLGHLLLADIAITFRIECGGSTLAASEQYWSRSSTRPFRKVFASYSHRDMQIVEAMEYHVKALGYDYLRDVIHLRSGQSWNDRLLGLINEADIFQLFWSSNSARSNYVEREWRYALALNREAFIRPAFWEVPMPVPPEPLQALHFYRLPALVPLASEETVRYGVNRPVVTEAKPDETNAGSLFEPPGPSKERDPFASTAPTPETSPNLAVRPGKRGVARPPPLPSGRPRRGPLGILVGILSGIAGASLIIFASFAIGMIWFLRTGSERSKPAATAVATGSPRPLMASPWPESSKPAATAAASPSSTPGLNPAATPSLPLPGRPTPD